MEISTELLNTVHGGQAGALSRDQLLDKAINQRYPSDWVSIEPSTASGSKLTAQVWTRPHFWNAWSPHSCSATVYKDTQSVTDLHCQPGMVAR